MGIACQARKMLGRPRLRSDVRWRITANTLIIVCSIATLVVLIVALELHIRKQTIHSSIPPCSHHFPGAIVRLASAPRVPILISGTRGRCLSANSYLGAHTRRLSVGIASTTDKCLATEGDASRAVETPVCR